MVPSECVLVHTSLKNHPPLLRNIQSDSEPIPFSLKRSECILKLIQITRDNLKPNS